MNPPEPAPRHNRRGHRVCPRTSDPLVKLKTLLSIHPAAGGILRIFGYFPASIGHCVLLKQHHLLRLGRGEDADGHAAFSDYPGPSFPIVRVVLLMKQTGSRCHWPRRGDYILGLPGPEP